MAAGSRWRRWAFRAAAVLGAIAVALLLVEGAIRLFPGVLNEKLRHAALSRYDTYPQGIYQYEGITRMNFMRPDFRTRTYSHGYAWTHRTDERGFRNPTGTSDHRILLLGDSLVYGHGVEHDETVTHVLRTEHRLPVYDLSAQGQCLYQHYVTLRLFMDELDPEIVLLFVYVNDTRDLMKLRRLEFEPGPPELDRFDYDLIRRRLDAVRRHRDGLIVRAAYSSSLFRLFAKTYRWRPRPPVPSRTPPEWRPPPRRINPKTGKPRVILNSPFLVLDARRFAPIEAYYDTVLSDLARRCADRGTGLVLVHLVPPPHVDWPKRERAQDVLHASLAEICGRHGIELFDTRRLFGDRRELILSGDGHLNPEGHRVLAGFVAGEALPRGVPGTLEKRRLD